MAVTLFFYKNRKDQLARESGAATEPTATSEQIKLENTGGRPIVHNPVRGVQQVVAGKLGTTQIKLENAAERQVVHNPVRGVQHLVTAKLKTAQTTNAAKEADPVELWKAVKRGSVSAEVALANLYLEGEAVPQNCEQAHMLLHAASMKGNKAADDLLKSSYTARCE
jgi:TPR repeat protein